MYSTLKDIPVLSLPRRSSMQLPEDIRLPGGKQLLLRELRPADRNLLKSFFKQRSPESIRYRFLASLRIFSEGLLDYLANTDGNRHVALIVTEQDGANEQIVAEGRYAVQSDRPDFAEVAFLVSEGMRRRGLATLLIRKLIDIGHRNGVSNVSADVLYENEAMVSLIRKLFRLRSSRTSNGVIHFEMPLENLRNEGSSLLAAF